MACSSASLIRSMISRWNSSALGVSTTGPVIMIPSPQFAAATERDRR